MVVCFENQVTSVRKVEVSMDEANWEYVEYEKTGKLASLIQKITEESFSIVKDDGLFITFGCDHLI